MIMSRHVRVSHLRMSYCMV